METRPPKINRLRCGEKCEEYHDVTEREVRDLPWKEYRTTVVIEGNVYGVQGAECG